ncbi:cholesterol 7-alpha-monooxygenase [Rhypophila decipiens]|uniref:Cholesterol 7-alpha-monooxygenase n=1 Tax=Rhypophila decipiens TaxID=261697 RepID=A0AAN7AZX6_9PEZI|nr:cholesterol 7-alpha-monooxygenase [Rhypophila decipiens]
MLAVWAVVLSGAAALYIFLCTLLHLTQDKNEPRMVETTIPFLSPILGMAARKGDFYPYMRKKYKLPIYTLRMPGTKLYIINSTALLSVVQRQHRTLSFKPIEAKGARDMLGCSDTADKIVSLDPTKDGSYLMTFNKFIHPALAPGIHLDAMNKISVRRISEIIGELQAKAPKKMKLFEWTRHSMLLVSTDSFFGPRNPFRDPALEEAWYRFEPSIIIFLLGLFPSILASDALKAREQMAEAIERYLLSGAPHDPDTSELIRARLAQNNSFSMPIKDQARFEVGSTFGILGNTIPSSFWILFHIYSDPSVFFEIRDEVSKLVTTTVSGDGVTTHSIDAAAVRTSCPILLSTLREVFRYHGVGISPRMVMEDHLLDGKYLLKKGNTVMIPGRVQHMDDSIWGPDVSTFNHRRFVTTDAEYQRASPIAFRGFGGGTTLCPGRHFASTEILVFAALMVMRFDVRPVGGKLWVQPTVDKSPMAAAVPVPDGDIEVEVELRGPKEQEWRVSFSCSGAGVEL